jgi:hypothetical protein
MEVRRVKGYKIEKSKLAKRQGRKAIGPFGGKAAWLPISF